MISYELAIKKSSFDFMIKQQDILHSSEIEHGLIIHGNEMIFCWKVQKKKKKMEEQWQRFVEVNTKQWKVLKEIMYDSLTVEPPPQKKNDFEVLINDDKN